MFRSAPFLIEQSSSMRIPFRISRARMSTNKIRKSFITYFEDYDHIHVPSSSVVTEEDDKSILFTNAGMNQFKSIFLGGSSNRWSYLERAVNYQKCLRVGGKHNDLEDVGRDLHHQTFFEMLGNWSFNGGYSKAAACELAWNFLVDVIKINPERLYVTYFGGDKDTPRDEKCRQIWLKIGVPDSHIIPFVKDNFWEMGAVGPCGPCAEIHYDRVEGRKNAQDLVNRDASVVELWNIVFMNMNRNQDGSLSTLPNVHIDTGMGLERLASVAQSVSSNFDTDVFEPLLKSIHQSSQIAYGGRVGPKDSRGTDTAYRIVADHLRAVTIALSDGVQPAADGAGFIIRKMLRRASWQAVHRLGMDRGSTAALVPVVTQSLGSAYPGLSTSCELIQKAVASEEEQYWKILDRGRQIFDTMVVKMPQGASVFPGEEAWKLHDTHGFPIDVTEHLLKEQQKTVDLAEFNRLKLVARQLSQSSSSFSLSSFRFSSEEFPTHSDAVKYDYKLAGDGYEFPRVPTKVLGLFSENASRVDALTGKGSVILENCQFYAEEGGQKSDRGQLSVDGTAVFNVESAQKVQGVTVLYGETMDSCQLRCTSEVEQHLDEFRRSGLMRAHTATHLLNWALQRIGAGEGQRGSAVDVDSLRFDYATGETAGEDDVVDDLEKSIREIISDGRQVLVEEVPLEEAKHMPRLQSEFREKKQYPSIVRVACVGESLSSDEALAVECCSGTHVLNTRSLVDFCVVSDRSSAKGVRRILALTGDKAREARSYGNSILERLRGLQTQSQGVEDLLALRKSIDWTRVPLVASRVINEELRKLKKAGKSRKI